MMTAAPDDVPSPCVKLCRLDPDTKLCSGCWRTAAEIAHWTRMSKDRRRHVLARIAGRRMSATG